jgi:Flp pilus assembly protein TadD
LDPNYARAYAIKSFVATNLVPLTAHTPAEVRIGRDRAAGFARTALSIAPNLPIGHSALAYAYSNNLQLSEAIREHRTAFSLASGDPDVIRNYGWTSSYIAGNMEYGLRLVDEALALDPLNWASHWAHVDVLFLARRYRDAVGYSLTLKRKSPELFKFAELYGRSLLMLGKTNEAAVAFSEVPDEVARMGAQGLIAARTGDRENALATVASLQQRKRGMAGFACSAIYAQAGEIEKAFAALDAAWEYRDSALSALRVDPFLDPLRSDRRFAALVKSIGFPRDSASS